MIYRLPDGTTTEHQRVYLDGWHALSWALEALTGWAVSGFDPGFTLTSGTTSVSLPIEFVAALLAGHNRRIEAATGKPTKQHRPSIRTTFCKDCGVEVHSIGRGRNSTLCRNCLNTRRQRRSTKDD